jgi:phosphoribosylanthranilate isomerase
MEIGRVRQLFALGELIKICGLREPRHAAVAAAGGADLIGFIFAPARRQVSVNVARSCIAAARQAATGRPLLAVGVFVDAPVADVREVASSAGLDIVQLHGAEPPEYLEHLGLPAVKALRPRPGATALEIVAEIDRYCTAPVSPVGVLIDGYAKDATGGSGVRADWDLTADVAAMRPVLLGGGLDPGAVARAIGRVRPLGVDVSSGVERDAVKDPARIAAFIDAARTAFADTFTAQ